jgi:hypothetical protein
MENYTYFIACWIQNWHPFLSIMFFAMVTCYSYDYIYSHMHMTCMLQFQYNFISKGYDPLAVNLSGVRIKQHHGWCRPTGYKTEPVVMSVRSQAPCIVFQMEDGKPWGCSFFAQPFPYMLILPISTSYSDETATTNSINSPNIFGNKCVPLVVNKGANHYRIKKSALLICVLWNETRGLRQMNGFTTSLMHLGSITETLDST